MARLLPSIPHRLIFFKSVQCLFLLVFSFASSLVLAEDIKVLVARGTDVSNSNLDSMVINALNATLANTPNLQSYQYSLSPPITVLSFCDGNTNGVLSDEVSCAKADLKALRNSWSADIVILAVDQYGEVQNGMVCGKAPFSQLTISVNNHAKAYAVIDYPCFLEHPELPSHEVGHLLSLDHVNESSATRLIPLPFNHGFKSSSGPVGTVLHQNLKKITDNLYSNPISTIGPFNIPAGDITDANAAAVIDFYSWIPVSVYRPRPPKPSGYVDLLFCIGWDATHWVDWDGQLLYPGDYFEVEVQLPIVGLWAPFYEGPAGGTTYTTKEHQAQFRVRVISIGGVTIWVYFGTFENCSSGGGPM